MSTERQTLGVGEICWYFRQGDKNCDPHTAIVTRSNVSGILDLALVPPNAGAIFPKTAIRHVGDPWFKTPHGEKQKIIEGAWEYRGGKGPDESSDLSPEVMAGRVLKLYQQHKDADMVAAVAAFVTGDAWDDRKVLALVRPKAKLEKEAAPAA